MKDYDAIEETVFHYFEGYQTQNRERLERAFVVEIANMKGYMKNEQGELELIDIPYKDLIEKWTRPDYKPIEFSEGRVLSINIFSPIAATVVFDCGGKFFDTFQMMKIDGGWRIANKFFVDQ
jgi:hypothetical protein